MRGLLASAVLLLALGNVPARAADWESFGGWQGGSRTSYVYGAADAMWPGFAGVELGARLSAADLWYRYETLEGRDRIGTSVEEPGGIALLGARIQTAGCLVLFWVGGQAELKESRVHLPAGETSSRQEETGVSANGQISRSSSGGGEWNLLANYNSADLYGYMQTQGLAAVLKEKDSLLLAGPELIVQGNNDVAAVQAGLAAQWRWLASKLTFSLGGGYGDSWNPLQPSQGVQPDPWLSLGIYKKWG